LQAIRFACVRSPAASEIKAIEAKGDRGIGVLRALCEYARLNQ